MKIDGKGSVEQLEKGKPRGRCRKWRLWARSGGRNRSRRFSGTYREALAALEAFKSELEGEVPGSGTFGEFAMGWADMRAMSDAYDPNTIAKDYRHVRALSIVLGDVPLSDMDAEACADALARIKRGENASGRTLRNSTMQGIHTALGSIMAHAAASGRVASNPMRGLRPPKNDTPERYALGPGELGAFLDAVDGLRTDGRVVAVYLMACLALRRGEACALLDSCLSDGFARIERAVKDRDGSVSGPKSAAGVRTLPVPERLGRKVAEWRALRESCGLGDAPTLACDTRGGLLLPQNLYRWWAGDATHRGVRDGLGYPGLALHGLRHSNLTMMARHLSPFDLQRYAGWSSLEPARIYIHDDLRSVAAGVSEAWEGMG